MNDSKTISLKGKSIGNGHPCFIIAEAGVNHNGDMEMAKKLIDVASDACVDAVKFQTFKAELVMSPDAPKANYQKDATGAEESQIEMVKKFELSFQEFVELRDYCGTKGIMFLSTPFDEESADFLDDLGVDLFKVPSGEISNLPFLRHIASKGRPMILSTGMSNLSEVDTAVRVIRENGISNPVLLQCVSNYPADPADANIRSMSVMGEAFGVEFGYSDHHLGNEVSFAAVACGASVIEKHFTLDKSLPGPDHQASLDPQGLKGLVLGIRTIEKAMGSGYKELRDSEKNTQLVARRSMFARRTIPKGKVISMEDLIALRPGDGIPPNLFELVEGKTTNREIQAGTKLAWSDFQ